MATEGYVIIAANEQHYMEMAVSAACSLRHNDKRPIALLISGGIRIPSAYTTVFDEIVAFDPPPPFDGMFTRRFVLEEYSPFERCMHIDADCLLIGNNIDRFWRGFSGKPFGAMAQFQTTGKCYAGTIDVDEIIENKLAEGVYVTNWGVFYYESTGTNPVMAKARDLLKSHLSGSLPTPVTYFSRPGQYSDEPLWGVALAATRQELPQHDYGGLLQLTSPNTRDHEFNFASKSFQANKGGIARATGEIYHFAAMNPFKEYLRGLHYYRSALEIAPPDLLSHDNSVISSCDWSVDPDAAERTLTKEGELSFKFHPPALAS